MDSKFVLTVDGGGTTTDVCIAEMAPDGKRVVRGRATGGPSNLTSLGVDKTIDILEAAIQAALNDAGLGGAERTFSRALLGLAGGGDRGLCRSIEEWLASRYCAQSTVISDAELILAVAESFAPSECAAISLLVGTGSVAFFREPGSQKISRVGGWGSILGDDGSGYWIGQTALRRTLQSLDEGMPISKLTEVLMDTLDAISPREMVTAINSSDNHITLIASLTPAVIDLADEGDELAIDILYEAAIYIGLMVGQAVGRMRTSAADTVVACAGSVVTRQSTLSNRVRELVQTVGVRELHFIRDPVVAALQVIAQEEKQ